MARKACSRECSTHPPPRLVMNIAAKPLTDDDIRALAAYYAAVRIEVKSVPE